MSRVHRRGVIAGPRSGAARTYAEWAALISSKYISASWTASPAANRYEVLVTSGAVTGLSMTGSSWGPGCPAGFIRGASSALGRVVQHGLPLQAVLTEMISNGDICALDLEDGDPSTAFQAVSRNGFNSAASSSTTADCRVVRKLHYWNRLTDAPETMLPFEGLGPEPYDWVT